MSDVLELRAEITKLARLINVEPDDLEYLQRLTAADVREFREQLVELFYGGETTGLKRFVAPSKILPTSVIAAITKEAVGPVLAARITGLIDPEQAAGVVEKLPLKFVTDIAEELDPRRAAPVMAAMPTPTISAISGELVKRKDYVTMGRFVSFLDDQTTEATFAAAGDADLLRIAFVLEDKDEMTRVVTLLSDGRLGKIVRAAGRQGLWAEAVDLLNNVDDRQRARIADIVAAQDARTLDGLVYTADRDRLWPEIVELAAQMTDPAPFVEAINRADDAVFKSFVDAVQANSQWNELRGVLELVNDDRRAAMRARASKNRRLTVLKPVGELLT